MAKSQPQEGNLKSSMHTKTKADFPDLPPMTSQRIIARLLAQGRAKSGFRSVDVFLLQLEIVVGFTIYLSAYDLGLRHLKIIELMCDTNLNLKISNNNLIISGIWLLQSFLHKKQSIRINECRAVNLRPSAPYCTRKQAFLIHL